MNNSPLTGGGRCAGRDSSSLPGMPETLTERFANMNEIMMIRNDRDGRSQLRTFQVDDSTLARLTKIRGNLYRDDPRLRTVADMPTMQQPQTPEPQISPEILARAEASYRAYKENERKAATMTPEPPKPMSFEEQIQHEWRTRPDIRGEFVSLTSYEAYCRAVRDGRTKGFGR